MKIKDIVTFLSKSITPQKGEKYNLYSLPSYDEGKTCEIVDGSEIQSNKYVVPNKCILFNKLNVRFKRVWRVESNIKNKLCSTEFLPLVVNEEIVDYQYCYYLLISDCLTNYLCGQNTNTSGSHKRIDPENFLNISITLPKMSDQIKIGKTLSDIDHKIELNKKINDNLEAMAKQLYDYWFVQFDFPNKEGKPYKSSGGELVWNEKLKREIPKGWEVKHLGDIIETNRGISYNTSSISGGGVPMINLASFNVNGTYKDAGIKTYNGSYTKEKVLKPFDLVLCNTQQTAIDFSKDIIGKAFLVPDVFEGDIVSSHHINTIKTEDYYKAYIAYLSNTSHFHKYAAGCCSGTNILGLDFNSFSQYKMEIPPVYLLEEFQKIIIDIVKRESVIIKENKTLTKQRDELLPLLMNGQATVNYHLSDD